MVGMLRRRPSRAYTKRARERSRVAAHIARAEKIARENAPVLDPMRSLVRALLLQALREYREEGRFPKNHHTDCHTPVFVDEYGTHCAVGHLLALSGEGALVEKISAERNLATVHQLSDEPALAQWLQASGISLVEAELIQPSYSPACSSAEHCFCTNFQVFSTADAGPPPRVSAVLECTVLSSSSARIDVIHGTTTGYTVGQSFELAPYQLTHAPQGATRILVPVTADGTQPPSWQRGAGQAGPHYVALEADGTATCSDWAINVAAVNVSARSSNVINAWLSDDCAASLATSERTSRDRVCNGCSCAVPASSHTETPSATLSILLSLVSALVVRRARRARSSPRAPSAGSAQSQRSIAQ